MHLPDDMPGGKRIPLWRPIPGCSFRRGLQRESASHSEREFRVVVSARAPSGKRIPFRAPIPGRAFRLGPVRKVRPIPSADSGMCFPLRTSTGNCRPFCTAAPKAAPPDSSDRCLSAHITCPRPRNPKSQNSRKNCLFSQKYTHINLPSRHNWRPFTGADHRSPIQFLKLTSKQAIHLHG